MPPYDAYRLAEAWGYRVEVARSLGGPCGLLIGRTILVLTGLSLDNQAITVCHELAHVLADSWRVIPESDVVWFESLMDAVAVATLMPRGELVLAIIRGQSPDEILSRYPNAPRPAAAQRLWSVLVYVQN